MMRVLVTGAAGFLGSRVFSKLAQAGHDVVGVDVRPLPPHTVSWPPSARFIQGDLWNDELRSRVLGGVTAVCHLAAFIPPKFTDPTFAEMCLRQNALLTLEMLRVSTEARIEHFVYSSSAGVVGGLGRESVALESASLFSYPEGPFYYGSKLLGEIWAGYYAETSALAVAIVRPGSLYGVGMPPRSAVPVFMQRAFDGMPLRVLDGGVAQFDYVHVDDVADLVGRILQNKARGIYNAGTGRAVSVLELADIIRNLFPERRVTIDVEPPSAHPRRGVPALDISKAQMELAYRPRSVEEGLRDMKEHMVQSSR